MDNNTIIIRNYQEYTFETIGRDLHITRINYIDEATLFKKNLRGSKILECKINNILLDNKLFPKKNYNQLLIILYNCTNKRTILHNTILNITQEEIYDKGFHYYEDLGLSIQGADARRTLKEIINIIKVLDYSIELKIKLKNDEDYLFKLASQIN